MHSSWKTHRLRRGYCFRPKATVNEHRQIYRYRRNCCYRRNYRFRRGCRYRLRTKLPFPLRLSIPISLLSPTRLPMPTRILFPIRSPIPDIDEDTTTPTRLSLPTTSPIWITDEATVTDEVTATGRGHRYQRWLRNRNATVTTDIKVVADKGTVMAEGATTDHHGGVVIYREAFLQDRHDL